MTGGDTVMTVTGRPNEVDWTLCQVLMNLISLDSILQGARPLISINQRL